MTTRQQEDLFHVLRKLDHLTGHLSDLSTFVGDREPYSQQLDIDVQELYIKACDLLHDGQKVLQQFNPALKFPETNCYHPSTAMMPDMPLRCCLECQDAGDFTGMVFPDGKNSHAG
jgi:hypothetical protein